MKTRRISLAGIAVAILLLSSTNILMAQKAGLFLDNWEAKTAVCPNAESANKPTEAATVMVTVDTSQVIAKVPQYIYGNNAVTWDNGLSLNTTAMTDLRNLDPHVLRWPGGSLSNSYFWNRPYGEGPDDIPAGMHTWGGDETGNWPMSQDDYYAMLETTNSVGCIVVNYSYARYGTSEDPVAQAAHLAADWVRYDNGRTKFWELGNENFGNWEVGNAIDLAANKDGQPEYISGQLYGEHCVVFIDSMRAAAAEIGVDINTGLVTYDTEDSWDPISEVWNEGMMPQAGHLADFLSVHSYFTPYDQDSPASTILNSHNVPEHIYSAVEADMSEAGQTMLPVAMTEWNIFAVGSMQAVSFVNGMHAALTLGSLLENGYGMGNRWDLVNGWDNGNDHAMFSSGGEPGVDEYNPRPAFFYMYYFQHYFGDRMVVSEVSGNSNVISYASSFSSGECGVVLINKSTTGQTLELDIENYEPGNKYYTMTLTGGVDNGEFSRKVFLNGTGTDEEGGGPDEYEDVKAIALESEGGILVDLPARGVVYVMVEINSLEYVYSKLETDASVVDIEFSDEVVFTEDPTGFVVNVNWSGPRAITSIEIDPVDARWIHITLDEVILPSDDVTISYSGTEVTSADGICLAPFVSEMADNLLPGAAPKLKEAATNEAGDEIRLLFTKDMIIAVSSHEDFTLLAEGDPDIDIALAGATLDLLDSKIVVLSVSDPIFADYELNISYSGSSLESSEAVPLGNILGAIVENNAPGIPPEVLTAETNEAGDKISVGFSKTMNNLSGEASNFAVTLDGTDATISEIVSSGVGMSILISETISSDHAVTLSYSGSTALSSDRGQLQVFTDFQVENMVPAPFIFDIPGTIDAELYNSVNGMDLETCYDVGGGQNLGWIDQGDWVEYMIDVEKTGHYKGFIRTSSEGAGGQVTIQSPEAEIVNLQSVSLPATGNWQTFASTPVEIILYQGVQRFRLYATTNGYNINWLSLEFDRELESDIRPSNAQEIMVYPNPVNDRLFIEADLGISSIEIIDITGKKVMHREYDAAPSELRIDLDFSDGLYLLKVTTGQSVAISRLVVQ